MRKLSVFLVLVVILNLCAGLAAPAKGEASIFWGVVTAFSEYAYAKSKLIADEKNQEKAFRYLRRQYGVSKNEAAQSMMERIFQRVGASTGNEEVNINPPKYFVNPDKNFNGFRALGNVITINEGVFTLCNYNEDIVAFVVTHEIAHGTKQHILRSADTILTLQAALNTYAERSFADEQQLRLMDWVARHAISKGYNVPFEWEADNMAFVYGVNAGYNPGAAAAGEFIIGRQSGGGPRNFVYDIIIPPSHPPNNQRVENFSRKLTEYSGNTVKVQGSTVFVKDQVFVQTKQLGKQYAEERAFLVAGHIARVLHDNPSATGPASEQNGAVVLAGYTVIVPGPDEPSAEELRDKLNTILGAATLQPPTRPNPQSSQQQPPLEPQKPSAAQPNQPSDQRQPPAASTDNKWVDL